MTTPITTYQTAFSATTPKTVTVDALAGDVIVVKTTDSSNYVISAPTNTGTALTWTLRQSVQVAAYASAYVWTSTVDTPRTGMVITLTGNTSGYWGALVEVWRGVAVGASSKANVSSGAPTLNVTTTAVDTAITILNTDYYPRDGATRSWRTGAGPATETFYLYRSGRATWYSAFHSAAGAVGVKTVGLSAPTGQKYSIIGLELVPTGPGVQPATGIAAATSGVSGTATGGSALPSIPLLPTVWTSAGKSHAANSLDVLSEKVPVPPRVRAGDLLILYTTMNLGTLADVQVPTGFTQLGELLPVGGTGARHSVAYKVAGASEPATYTYGRLSASADASSVMLAVRDWDGNTANLRYAQQETSRTVRAAPSVTPATGSGLVLHSVHHASSSSAVWKWIAPNNGIRAGQFHNARSRSSTSVSLNFTSGTATISGINWLESSTTSTQSAMITTSLTIGGGTGTRPTTPSNRTSGTGGPLTDRTGLTHSNGTKSSTYHCYAAGLDWTKPVGLLVYTDGSGDWGLNHLADTYLMPGTRGLIATAKKHNMVLLTPLPPGNGCLDGDGTCWYENSGDGTTAAQKLAWSVSLITTILGQYDIDKSRMAVGGYSSGAQWTTQFFGPGHAHAFMTDGVLFAISYGGIPKVVNNNTAAFKTNVPLVWNVGSLDDSWIQTTWTDGVQEALDSYTAAGYDTHLELVAGATHNRYETISNADRGEYGTIVDHIITAYVRPPTTP